MASWQDQFAASLLQRLRIPDSRGARQAIVGWIHAEGGHTNGARYNPLNTTQSAPGAGNTGTQGNIKVYRNWQQGVEATAQTLLNGNYGGIIAGLKSGNPSAVAHAIGSSPWGTSGQLVSQTIAQAVPGASSGFGTRPGSSRVARPGILPTSSGTPAPGGGGFDQAAYDQAVRRQRLATFLAHGQTGRDNPLFRLGLLSTAPVDASQFATGETPANGTAPTSTAVTPLASASGGGLGAGSSSIGRAAATVARRYGSLQESAGSNRGPGLDKLESTTGMIGQPWCGIFAGAVLGQLGVHGIGSWIASVAEIEVKARAGQGPFSGFSQGGAHARPGDLVIPARGVHVAVVQSVSNGVIHVIGGNNSNGTWGPASYNAGSVYGVAHVR